MNVNSRLFSALILSLSVATAAMAQSGSPGTSGSMTAPQQMMAVKKDVDALKAEMEALRKKVSALEAIKPTFTAFMPNFAERFHVMHRAAEVGDWAVANHELSEMKRLIGVAMVIDAKNGALLKSFMSPNFKKLDAAIEHGNLDGFNNEMAATVKSCNACHAAVGSPFVQVTLEVDKSLTLRHPHAFDKTKVPKEHGH